MVAKSVSAAIAASQADKTVRRGRPYLEEYEHVPYPKGFSSPNFKMFDGTGNPKQHIAQYRASCCNTGGSDALLLKQFVTSLTGIAFEWYAELPNNTIKTFDELETMFIARFASAHRKYVIGDLVLERKKQNESLPEYIIRWRNLSLQCEPQLIEEQAVDILLRNIIGPMAPLLRGFEITTFQVLLDKVTRLLPVMPKSSSENEQQKDKFQKYHKNGNHENKIARVAIQKDQQVLTSELPNRSKQKFRKTTIEERLSKKYSFKKESVQKIFNLMLKAGLELPEPRRSHEAELVDDPLYCPYHRCLGHTIENCYIFKDIVEGQLKNGDITLSKRYLLPEASVHVVSHVGQVLQPIQVAHVCMVDRASKASSSLQYEGESEDDSLWQIIQSKDSEVAHLKSQINEMAETIRQLVVQLREVTKVTPTTSTDVVIKAKEKEKKIYPTKDTSNSSEPLHVKQSLEEKKSRRYSFKRNATKILFNNMIRSGFQLPEPKRPKEISMESSPNYCPYHRCIGHIIEDCFVFKDILEKKYQENVVHILEKHLQPKCATPKAISKSKTIMSAMSQNASQSKWKFPIGIHLTDSESSDEEQIIYAPLNVARNQGFLKSTPGIFNYTCSSCGAHSQQKSDDQKSK